MLNSLILTIYTNLSIVVSVYQPVAEQCNIDPITTASGMTIDTTKDVTNLRWCAISRNLHKRYGGKYEFGDTIRLRGVGKFNGYFIVQDLMNKRFKNKVDILVDKSHKTNYLYKNKAVILNYFKTKEKKVIETKENIIPIILEVNNDSYNYFSFLYFFTFIMWFI